jgi:putative transposase
VPKRGQKVPKTGRICFHNSLATSPGPAYGCSIPRTARNAPGGYVYHALNRAAARQVLFRKPVDYDAFVRVLDDALERCPIRILAYCPMPTHWHFVLWPQRDDQLSAFQR